jgi:predicted signal transduction protein with EAL and GGDEF domain
VDVVKIDRSFTDELRIDERKSAIVGALIQVSHELGFSVVAEGWRPICRTSDCSRWAVIGGRGSYSDARSHRRMLSGSSGQLADGGLVAIGQDLHPDRLALH